MIENGTGRVRLIDHGASFGTAGSGAGKMKEGFLRNNDAMMKAGHTPAEMIKPYIAKEKEIRAAMEKAGMPKKYVEEMSARLKAAGKAKTWSDLYAIMKKT